MDFVRLRESKNNLLEVVEPDYPGIPPGTIVKQAPPAGYKVGADTPIALTYSELTGAQAN